jgi:Flp pilus assembly protein TadD
VCRLLALREWGSAANAFRESLRLRPDAASIWMHLGYACKELDEKEDARSAFEAVMRLVGHTPMAAEAAEHLRQLLCGSVA